MSRLNAWRLAIAWWLLRPLLRQAHAEARSAVILPSAETSRSVRQAPCLATAQGGRTPLWILPAHQAEPLLRLAGKTGGPSVRIPSWGAEPSPGNDASRAAAQLSQPAPRRRASDHPGRQDNCCGLTVALIVACWLLIGAAVELLP